MKTLIVYYSHTENNKKLAQELQKKLDCDIVEIEELKKRTGFAIFMDLIFNRMPPIKTVPRAVNEYDQVICVAPIWGAKIASPMKTFLHSERGNMNQYAFISVCGGAPGQKDKIAQQLTSLVGKKPVHVGELWIHDLLPKQSKDIIKYRIDQKDLRVFASKVDAFLQSAGMSVERVSE